MSSPQLLPSTAPLVARDLSKSYGDRVVLSGFDLTARPERPVGVVGENGVGKSTLLRLLAGVGAPDSGQVVGPSDLGYLEQDPEFDRSKTISEVLASALAPLHDAVARLERLAMQLDDPVVVDEYAEVLAWAEQHAAWDADRRAEQAASRLGLEALDRDRPVGELSGGERTRLAMAALITRRPACVILDEPTNHLDDAAMEFVEDFLTTLPGVVILASHDRVLLDRVCVELVDLDDSHFGVDGQGGNRFSGGFTDYLVQKEASRARWDQAFAEQQDELNALRVQAKTKARQVAHNRGPRDNDKFIYQFKGANVQNTIRRRVRDAEQRIEAVERDLIPKPPAPLAFDSPLTAGRQPARLSVRGLRVDGRLTLERLDVAAGEHLLVTGANGSGKSTLLQVLAGELAPDAGDVDISARRVELLPQDVRFSRGDWTPQQAYRELTSAPVPLGNLGLLHPRELNRPIGVLSTGQQRRLALAIVVARQPDLLLLDEPTNHISLALASEIEDALGRSSGTVIVASHDRWLRRAWSDPILHLP